MANIATRDAYGEALAELGAINNQVVVLDADLSKSTKTNDFKKVYPERFFNLGIAEQNLLGTAAGFAAAFFAAGFLVAAFVAVAFLVVVLFFVLAVFFVTFFSSAIIL